MFWLCWSLRELDRAQYNCTRARPLIPHPRVGCNLDLACNMDQHSNEELTELLGIYNHSNVLIPIISSAETKVRSDRGPVPTKASRKNSEVQGTPYQVPLLYYVKGQVDGLYRMSISMCVGIACGGTMELLYVVGIPSYSIHAHSDAAEQRCFVVPW